MLTAHRFLLKAEVRCGYVRIYSYNSAQNQRSILQKKNSLYSSDAVCQVRIPLLLLYSIVMQLQIRPLHVALLRQNELLNPIKAAFVATAKVLGDILALPK